MGDHWEKYGNKANAARRQKYRSDPEYREQVLARNRKARSANPVDKDREREDNRRRYLERKAKKDSKS